MADDTGIPDPARARRRGAAPFLFVVVESAVTTALALGWLMSALQGPEGHTGLVRGACGVLGSVVVTGSLRLVPGHVLRHAVDGVIALRLVAVLVVTAVLLPVLVGG
ncbi:hypothetical protein [Streptomyces roseolilacinus]|uniref:Uncharacterized protein n=1 Tax=Streptomyces roseolilacinus TaxID=66904 RepID=A0A918EKM4_9ACTN|nr:hypothetical protein [Streptomyces roseolilacinus]GGQ00376.1 hypothetical protein GCM10010249_18260 [Streptomyces roseolilacinus]